MELLRKNQKLNAGYNPIMDSTAYPLRYLKFGRLLLQSSSSEYMENSGTDEVVISVFSGRCDIHINERFTWSGVGGRESVLSGPPTMVYIPRNTHWVVRSRTEVLHAGIFRADARRDTEPKIVNSNEVKVRTPGADSWMRHVTTVIGDNVDADRLIVGETYSLPGRWSSYPPHKHDTKSPPREAWYEEVYHYLIEPQQGFGVQLVYTAPDDPEPLDEAYIVHNGDTIAIPRGYHPVVAAGGYRMAYYWALAGEERMYAAWSDDPFHAWLRNAEPILRSSQNNE